MVYKVASSPVSPESGAHIVTAVVSCGVAWQGVRTRMQIFIKQNVIYF